MSRKRTNQKKRKKLKNLAFDTEKFIDRELSWLEFDRRVLEQAQDKAIPLLERLFFLNIFHLNLDEFFMKRIAGRKFAEVVEGVAPSAEMMDLIRNSVTELLSEAADCFEGDIRPNLEAEGLSIVKWTKLNSGQRDALSKKFQDKIFPLLVPLAVDSAHPFPHISNLSTSLAVSLRYPERPDMVFSRIKVPDATPLWLKVPATTGEEAKFIPTVEVIAKHLDQIFPKMEIVSWLPFVVTRNIELEKEEEEADDVLAMIEEELKQRRFGEVVKLEVGPDPDPWLLDFLLSELDITDSDVYINKSQYEFIDFSRLLKVDKPGLKFKPWNPTTPKELQDERDIFGVISQGDVFIHQPYESFTSSVERLVQSAADDPNVLSIKMTLYRTAEDGSLIRSLIRAVEKGKQVVVLVELKARFDEERNISWARVLEDAGVHILYGVIGLKTHSKTTLIIRKEGEKLAGYAHIGTGNYHSQTAKAYTDMGILTCRKEVIEELTYFFHYLTGRSLKSDYKHLLVAPVNMKSGFLELIDKEIAHAKAGRPAEILLKLNNLEDRDICERLYQASAAGVKIRAIVRSICVLKPGKKGLSENIEVIGIVDRFLEHSRLYCFKNGSKSWKDGLVYLGSADWMYRNLERRVEVAAPVVEPSHLLLCIESFETLWNDPTQAWTLQEDGSYTRRKGKGKSGQTLLLESARIRNKRQ